MQQIFENDEEDEDLLLFQEYNNSLVDDFAKENSLSISRNEGEEDEEDEEDCLMQEVEIFLKEEFQDLSQHMTIRVNSDGAIVYQSGERKNISTERFLTDEEKKQYTEDNLNLIHHMAHKYYSNNAHLDEYDEFYGEASIGFTKALNTYDIANKVRFANYACFCMENCLRTFCQHKMKLSNPNIAYSFDEPITDSGQSDSLLELYINHLEDSLEDSVEKNIEYEQCREVLKEIRPELTKTQFFCLISFYGLGGSEQLSKIEMSRMLNIPVHAITLEINRAMDIFKKRFAKLSYL